MRDELGWFPFFRAAKIEFFGLFACWYFVGV